MSQSETRNTAQNMISVHGLRAQAVVHERIAEARHQADEIVTRARQAGEARR